MDEAINEIACKHCDEVMCSVCENKTCDDTHLATLKCREWRDRRAGFYCGYKQATKELQEENARLKKKERCVYKHTVLVNPNASVSASAICHSVYNCENCSLFKESEMPSKLDRAKELLRQCMKYHFHSEVTEYPYNDVETFLKEMTEEQKQKADVKKKE